MVVFLALLTGTCLYALWRGGAPERLAAGIMILATVATIIVGSHPRVFGARETSILVVDILMFFAFVGLSLKAHRYWPIWFTGFLGIGLALEFVMWGMPSQQRSIYKVLHLWNSYPTVLILLLGTIRHCRRVVLFGADKSWSNFSNRSAATEHGVPPLS